MARKSRSTPQIHDKNGFMVMGTVTRIKRGSESIEEFSSIWKEFESYHERIKPFSCDLCYYGVSFGTKEYGIIEYMAGMAVEKPMTIPEGLMVREIPKAKYAVFTCLVQAIGDMYRYIFEEWFSTSGYELDSSVPTFEKYPPAEDASSVVLIHIPIRRTESR